MITQSEKVKCVIEQAGFYRSGHPIQTYIKYLAQSTSVQELTDKISQRIISKGYTPLFADKLAICLFAQKDYLLS